VAFGAPFPGGGPVRGEFLGIAAGTSATLNFGAEESDRALVVIAGGVTAGNFNICTVAGQVATRLASDNNADSASAIWVISVPSGTSGTITVSATSTLSLCMIAAYAIYGCHSPTTPQATANGGFSASFNTLPGSFVIGGTYAIFAGGVSWSGLNGDATLTQSGLITEILAVASEQYLAAQSPLRISNNLSNTPSGVAAVWSP